MKDYEYKDEAGRFLCRLHHKLRCDECHYVSDLRDENKRYREAIEYIKIELRDFRKEANTIKKLSRDRIVQGEAFRLSCDIRDCLKALEQSE